MNVARVVGPGLDAAQEAGEAGCEVGEAVRQSGLVFAVDGLTDPVLPQPDVHGVEAAPHHAGHHSLAVLPDQPREAGDLPQALHPGRLHQAEVGGELLHQPGAAGPA